MPDRRRNPIPHTLFLFAFAVPAETLYLSIYIFQSPHAFGVGGSTTVLDVRAIHTVAAPAVTAQQSD